MIDRNLIQSVEKVFTCFDWDNLRCNSGFCTWVPQACRFLVDNNSEVRDYSLDLFSALLEIFEGSESGKEEISQLFCELAEENKTVETCRQAAEAALQLADGDLEICLRLCDRHRECQLAFLD